MGESYVDYIFMSLKLFVKIKQARTITVTSNTSPPAFRTGSAPRSPGVLGSFSGAHMHDSPWQVVPTMCLLLGFHLCSELKT